MLKDPIEIQIISRARQAGVRDPMRSREGIRRIIEDFIPRSCLANRTILDLGPGQYDFGELVQQLGAQVDAIDHDPAVVGLGRYKGYRVWEADFRDLGALDLPPFDGLFCRFSINGFWGFREAEGHRIYLKRLLRLLKQGGWGWVAPWNGGYSDDGYTVDEINRVIGDQIAFFEEEGFRTHVISAEMSRCYGIYGNVVNHVIFTRHLDVPDHLR